MFGRRVQGYVYVPDTDEGAMAGAHVGASIHLQVPSPPWIVVDCSLARIVVAKWPGKLWHVEIIEKGDNKGLREDAGYVRARAVKVLAEEPACSLFGLHGAAVSGVINAARYVSEEQAQHLTAARHPEAGMMYTRGWWRWLAKEKFSASHLSAKLENVLQIPGGRIVSPIGHGLSLVHDYVFERAKVLAGDAAFERDDEDLCLKPPWALASSALLEAALAFGAPDFLDPAERAILTAAWFAVIGADPA